MSKIKFKVQKFDKDKGQAIWILDGVRLYFPNLFKPGPDPETGSPSTRLSADFMVPLSEKALCKEIQTEMLKLAKTQYPKVKKISELKHPKVARDKKIDEDGDKVPGDHLLVKSSNSLDRPTSVYDNKGKQMHDPVGEGAEGTFYNGCVVKAKLTLNCDNKDKKVWVNLAAIQFVADGERIGGGGLSKDELDEGFGEVEGDFENDDFEDDVDNDDLDIDDDADDLDLDDDDLEL